MKPNALHILYAWLIAFGLIPLSMIVLTSFLSRDSQHLVTLPFTLKAYTSLFSFSFATVFCRSCVIALLTTLACLILAYPFSYVMIKSKRQSLMLLLIMIPFWTSSLIRTYAVIAILKFHGVLNNALLALHLIHQPLQLLYTNTAVGIGLVYTLFPFMVLPIFSNMERFDFQWIEAAKDLGANRKTLFFRILLPNTSSGIITGCLFVFLPAMTLFYIPNVLGGARSVLLGNLIQNQFLTLENWPQGAATSVILTFILFALIPFFRRHKQELIA